jgi:hypothetical protein
MKTARNTYKNVCGSALFSGAAKHIRIEKPEMHSLSGFLGSGTQPDSGGESSQLNEISAFLRCLL